MSSKEKTTASKIGINYYETFLTTFITYFINWKRKEKKKLIQNNDNETNALRENITDKNEKEKEKYKKECIILIREFIRKIIYMKKIYIYYIIKKHYCKDLKKKNN